MTEKKEVEKNAEQTLITLDQLSQTLEVMSHVVDRLKQHLSRQLSLNAELFQDEENLKKIEAIERAENSKKLQEKSFVIEITQQELLEGSHKKTIH
tara:strand:+ start:117 stop:404 length:288 start_codon:yes stop_codon:yes gene_type:complete